MTTDEEGINTYYYRENLNGLGYCRESIDPQELAIGYLRNFDTWDITGEEAVAGRYGLVLEGRCPVSIPKNATRQSLSCGWTEKPEFL